MKNASFISWKKLNGFFGHPDTSWLFYSEQTCSGMASFGEISLIPTPLVPIFPARTALLMHLAHLRVNQNKLCDLRQVLSLPGP